MGSWLQMSGRFGPGARVRVAQDYRCFVTRGCNWAESGRRPLALVEDLDADLELSACPRARGDP